LLQQNFLDTGGDFCGQFWDGSSSRHCPKNQSGAILGKVRTAVRLEKGNTQ